LCCSCCGGGWAEDGVLLLVIVLVVLVVGLVLLLVVTFPSSGGDVSFELFHSLEFFMDAREGNVDDILEDGGSKDNIDG